MQVERFVNKHFSHRCWLVDSPLRRYALGCSSRYLHPPANIGEHHTCPNLFTKDEVVAGDLLSVTSGTQPRQDRQVSNDVFIGLSVTPNLAEYPRRKAHPDCFAQMVDEPERRA